MVPRLTTCQFNDYQHCLEVFYQKNSPQADFPTSLHAEIRSFQLLLSPELPAVIRLLKRKGGELLGIVNRVQPLIATISPIPEKKPPANFMTQASVFFRDNQVTFPYREQHLEPVVVILPLVALQLHDTSKDRE